MVKIHLKNLKPFITFTTESRENFMIPFLEVQVRKTSSGFITLIYRKSTYIGCYLNFKSNHSFSTERYHQSPIDSDKTIYSTELRITDGYSGNLITHAIEE